MTVEFTSAQRVGVEADTHNLQIIAGAGSGKTQVMASRVVELLARPAVAPSSIVAFTFTERAAAELKERIYRLAQDRFGQIVGLADMFVGTMHAYCLALLQTHLYRFLKYEVLSDVQTRLLIDRNSTKSGLTTVHVASGPSRGRPLRRGVDSRLYIQMLGVLREDEVDSSRVPDEVMDALSHYRALLHEHRYLDYTEIILEAVQALESELPENQALRAYLAEAVRYVIVDEYQDVNPLQERLVRSLSDLGASVAVVGDDDQTIYQWRGSDIGNILTFADRYPDVVRTTLGDNFRSSSAIVDVGSFVASLNDPDRLEKEMVAASHQVFERGDLLALAFAMPEDEAEWIADQVQDLRGRPFEDQPGGDTRGLSWSDCAILLRSVAKNAEPIVEEFKKRGIPYVIGGLSRLFETDEIWACVASFQYAAGVLSRDEVRDAWRRANLGLTDGDIDRGIEVLTAAADTDRDKRWASYNLQRIYLNLLEAMQAREPRIPAGVEPSRPEVAMYNLGKFSQVISDFEQIHFHSEPKRKLESFAYWLQADASTFYEEGGADGGFAQPDAVQILTVHRAKGLQWPAVFVPALQRGRFPSRRHGGRTIWHVLPRDTVPDASRYDGSVADETRLFYVALTRSQKYLYCTYAPGESRGYQRPSEFFVEVTTRPEFLTRMPARSDVDRLVPTSRHERPEVALSFSQLKYYFECPYQFKLRFLYGFNAPIHEALGYGKSLHDALAEIHKRARSGDFVDREDVEDLLDRHMHTPFAYPELRENLRSAARSALDRYLIQNAGRLELTEHAEQKIELQVAPGISVVGRVDLIRRLDADEISIVDFKSTERAQAEDVTRTQLHIYALGYEALTGNGADLLEVLNLDSGARNTRELVDRTLLEDTQASVAAAGEALRENALPRLRSWCGTCSTCDVSAICRSGP